MGYRRFITYTLLGEVGTVYRATGWKPVAFVRGREWSCPSRSRKPAAQSGPKIRWETGPEAFVLEPEDAERLDALVRESVGRVEIRARRHDEHPLFAGREPPS